ncbi:unnamed protein product [Amoebophrya sp. A25]|nr:unnamed protein product [Amoebophrya sp. A25]|eukprot:GSA25T00025496001.1
MSDVGAMVAAGLSPDEWRWQLQQWLDNPMEPEEEPDQVRELMARIRAERDTRYMDWTWHAIRLEEQDKNYFAMEARYTQEKILACREVEERCENRVRAMERRLQSAEKKQREQENRARWHQVCSWCCILFVIGCGWYFHSKY